MNASVRKEENMNANQVIKEQLARFSEGHFAPLILPVPKMVTGR